MKTAGALGTDGSQDPARTSGVTTLGRSMSAVSTRAEQRVAQASPNLRTQCEGGGLGPAPRATKAGMHWRPTLRVPSPWFALHADGPATPAAL